MWFLHLAKYTWKHYGVSLTELKQCTPIESLFQYEEELNVHNDYELANMKDTVPPPTQR